MMKNKVSERFYFIVFIMLSFEIIVISYGKRTISKKNEENIEIIKIYKYLLSREKIEYFPLVNVINIKSGIKYALFSDNDYRLIVIIAIPTIDYYTKEIHDIETISKKQRDKAIFLTLVVNKPSEFKNESEDIYYLENPMQIEFLNKAILFITKSDGEIILKAENNFKLAIENIIVKDNT